MKYNKSPNVTRFVKEALYTHPNFQLKKYITPLVFDLHLWNIVTGVPYHYTNMS